MREFFDNIPLDNEEEISKERLDNIKTSALSRVKEEKAMSKRTTIKTITIAVAAATTAALSAIIASADSAPAATTAEKPAAAVEEETEKPGEAAFKEYIEKAKAEDTGAQEEAPETVNGWEKVDPKDLVTLQPADNPDVCYYYYKVPDEVLEEMLNNGWTSIDGDVNTIHKNEVFVTD